MTSSTLTDRYIQAVTRTLPEKQRDDVARELGASIADQIDARIEAGEQPENALKAVLEGLGDPDTLAAGYADRPLHLIGPRFYLAWKRLLTILLWIVPACVVFAVALGQTLAGAPLGEIIGTTIGAFVGIVGQLFFWVTLVFAILERAGATDALTPWSLELLPEPRESGARLSDAVLTIVHLGLTAGVIVWDLTIGFAWPWHVISILNPAAWPVVLGLIALVMVAAAALAIAVYRHGRWTFPFAIANAALAVGTASILLTALGRGLLLNPAMFELAIAEGASDDLPDVLTIVVAFVIVGLTIWSVIDGFLKARRARA